MNKIFALVDCNSFYCSCERLFRPDLRNHPVGVLSNNDGCFVSRTNELKKLGVPMGAPYFQYKKICDKNKVAVFSANFALYTNISDRVMNTLFQFTPSLEVYSVDEAFLDLTGFDEKTIVDYCYHIKETVERHTGIPVGIGIGRTKVLAKVANKIAKKNEKTKGVFSVLEKEQLNWALKNFDIQDIWGIGKKSAIKMKALGIHKACDLRDFKNELLIQKQFTKIGRMIQDELREISCFPLNNETPKKKEIICSRSFGAPVFDLYSLRESVACYASLACEKLRKQESVCTEIEVYIQTNPFKETVQYARADKVRLSSPTSDTRKIIREAWTVLDRIFINGIEYKKAMVKLSHIQDAKEHQVSLFGDNDTLKDIALMQTLDRINAREGHEMVKVAACGTNKAAWYMKQVLKSPRYVTGWSEIFKIMC
ncbi:MAG: Y-family DNA polymerase [Bacteriovoracaceae bacterium]|nr:Y-family DNA polymerase [Bacteriovoracaceae bacterium]